MIQTVQHSERQITPLHQEPFPIFMNSGAHHRAADRLGRGTAAGWDGATRARPERALPVRLGPRAALSRSSPSPSPAGAVSAPGSPSAHEVLSWTRSGAEPGAQRCPRTQPTSLGSRQDWSWENSPSPNGRQPVGSWSQDRLGSVRGAVRCCGAQPALGTRGWAGAGRWGPSHGDPQGWGAVGSTRGSAPAPLGEGAAAPGSCQHGDAAAGRDHVGAAQVTSALRHVPVPGCGSAPCGGGRAGAEGIGRGCPSLPAEPAHGIEAVTNAAGGEQRPRGQ